MVLPLPEVRIAINASSEQDKNKATKVPIVIYFFIYKSAPKTLVPHCGINPNNEPKTGPVFFLLIKKLAIWWSKNDKRKWNTKTKAKTKTLSLKESRIMSNATSQVICFLPFDIHHKVRIDWLLKHQRKSHALLQYV